MRCRPKAMSHREKMTKKNLKIQIEDEKNRNIIYTTKRNIANLSTASTFFHISPKKVSLSAKKPTKKTIISTKKTTLNTKKSMKPK